MVFNKLFLDFNYSMNSTIVHFLAARGGENETELDHHKVAFILFNTRSKSDWYVCSHCFDYIN